MQIVPLAHSPNVPIFRITSNIIKYLAILLCHQIQDEVVKNLLLVNVFSAKEYNIYNRNSE